MKTEPRRLIVGISGASGVIYGVRILEILKHHKDVETHLVMSKSAELTLAYETDYKPKDVKALASVVHPIGDIGANISSGSFKTMGKDLMTGLLISAPVFWAFTQFLAINLPGLTETGWL